MRLGVLFVITLAVSVLLGAAGTWAVTFSTSFGELLNLNEGFVQLTRGASADFGQLVGELIQGSEALVSAILDAAHNQSAAQLAQVGQQFQQTAAELTAQAYNGSEEGQGLATAIYLSFHRLMQTALHDFRGVAKSNAYRLRVETAVRVQSLFYQNVQNRIIAIQRQARLFQLGLIDVSGPVDSPPGNGTYALLGSVCAGAAELGTSLYLGTAQGVHLSCSSGGTSTFLNIQRGAAADYYRFVRCTSFSTAAFTAWEQACQQSTVSAGRTGWCAHGVGAQFPDYCNGTCGFDPRCRPWYLVFDSGGATTTQLTDMYIDAVTGNAVVSLSHPIYSGQRLVAATGNDFAFNDVDKFLRNAGISAAQSAAVIFNSSDLFVVGTNRNCPNGTGKSSGQALAGSCDPALQALAGWLGPNRGLRDNASVALNGTLWEVFPDVVEGVFAYFVVVGMNSTQVYAYVDNASQDSNITLLAIAQQYTSWLGSMLPTVLASFLVASVEKNATIQALVAEMQQHRKDGLAAVTQQFDSFRRQTAGNLTVLINDEMDAIEKLKEVHVCNMTANVGVTFAAVVGIFAAVLLAGSYGVWAVTKQFDRLMQVMEDVVEMRVEELNVTQNSFVREVHRIEVALCILVCRLAEYKSYMPAGLFQPGSKPDEPAGPVEPFAPKEVPVGSPRHREASLRSLSTASQTTPSMRTAVAVATGPTRLTRRSVTAMVVNIVRFQGEVAQRSVGQLEALLNLFIATVHGLASKAQGNIDAVVGDQLLVTFNAHFTCSDPPTAASTVAFELRAALQGDLTQCGQVQIGLAAGPVYAGHVGYAPFKSMLAVGAPLKVAALLAHLSGFRQPAVVVCPSVEERIKYHFVLQPADRVTLPCLGEHVSFYGRSLTVYVLEAQAGDGHAAQEWLYEVSAANEASGQWSSTFNQIARAEGLGKAQEELAEYVRYHPDDQLAQRLLSRLPFWQPRLGIVLAERPDLPRSPREVLAVSPSGQHASPPPPPPP